MWARLILINIRDFIRNKPVLFFFIILSQMICIVSAFTVAGMMDAVTKPPEVKDERSDWERSFQVVFEQYNYDADDDEFLAVIVDSLTGNVVYKGTDPREYKKYENDEKYSCELMGIPFNADSLPRYKDIKDKLQRIKESIGGHYSGLRMTGYTDSSFGLHFSAVDGEQNYQKLKSGEIELMDGNPVSTLNSSEGGSFISGSKEYRVKSFKKKSKGDIFPICELLADDADDNFVVSFVMFQVDDGLVGDELGQTADLIKKEFSGFADKIEYPVPKPLIEKQFNNMIYVVSFMLMAVMMLNLSRLYTYILTKRRNAMSIYSLCGASRIKIFAVYISEILLTLVFSYICGFLIFRFAVMELIGMVYPSFLTFFDLKICMTILGSYILFGGIVMGISILPMAGRSVYRLRRERSL